MGEFYLHKYECMFDRFIGNIRGIHWKYTWDSLEIYVGFIIACKIGTENLQTDQHSNNNYPKKAGSHKRERLLLQIYERMFPRKEIPHFCFLNISVFLNMGRHLGQYHFPFGLWLRSMQPKWNHSIGQSWLSHLWIKGIDDPTSV